MIDIIKKEVIYEAKTDQEAPNIVDHHWYMPIMDWRNNVYGPFEVRRRNDQSCK